MIKKKLEESENLNKLFKEKQLPNQINLHAENIS